MVDLAEQKSAEFEATVTAQSAWRHRCRVFAALNSLAIGDAGGEKEVVGEGEGDELLSQLRALQERVRLQDTSS